METGVSVNSKPFPPPFYPTRFEIQGVYVSFHVYG